MGCTFWFDWHVKYHIWVEVTALGFNTETETLTSPTIQFFEKPHGEPWRMYYKKEQFDTIMHIAYAMIVKPVIKDIANGEVK